VHEHTIGKWRWRFLKDRIEGLLGGAQPGRLMTMADDQVAAVTERTLRSKPTMHPLVDPLMECVTGFSHDTISRIWAAFDSAP
jgi:hypothetical protein